nr:unnamed protein product [Digitaria exilis]
MPGVRRGRYRRGGARGRPASWDGGESGIGFWREYLKRLNLYRQRVWTCKISGKSNLTFEEALVSEHNVVEKTKKLPAEFMSYVLRMIQYSTLGLYELVNKIYASLLEEVSEGIELHANKDGSVIPCKILKHNKKGRKRKDDGTIEDGQKKMKGDDGHAHVPTKYPIDDLLVKPNADDPSLFKRPPMATDFRVPRCSVGDLLMVWDFCSSFGRVLNLFPFPLTDMENAVCHKESNVLLVEIHAAMFHMLMKDKGDYFSVLQNKKRKLKVSLVTWAEYLCDFLEMTKIEELSSTIATVRRGYYGLIDTDIKLRILRELVEEAIKTSAIREILSERVDQKQALNATKRESTRKDKQEQNLNTETAMKKEENQTDAVQDSNESVDDLARGKEKDKSSRSKTEGKRHLVRHLDTEIEKLSIRSSPLGKDKHYNRYWFFRREGRLFVESADSREWGYYSTKEELDALIGSLNVKGIRERALKRQLEKFYNKISNALDKRTKEIVNKMLLEEGVLRRSTRVRAQPKDNPPMAFLKYVNKWKDN